MEIEQMNTSKGKFTIWESDRHGKAVAGTKKTSTIQVRNHCFQKGYMLEKQFPFPVGDYIKREEAIRKARNYIAKLQPPPPSLMGSG